MAENPSNGPQDPPALAARMAELEAQLEGVKLERDSLKASAYPVPAKRFPDARHPRESTR